MSTGYQLNLGTAYKYTSNRETVQLFDRGGGTVCTVIDAKRLEQGVREREISRGDYIQTDIDWRLPAANVTAIEITPGYSIIDTPGNAYVVIRVDSPGTYGSPWRCSCRLVRVQGFFNAVDWRQVNNQTDEYSDRITDPATFTLGGHAPARIQPLSADIIDILGKRGELNRYYCYVLPDWNLSFGDLLIDTKNNNATYKVTAFDSKQDIACAMRILCELLP